MRFDSASKLEEIIWNSRIADLPRGEDRATLQRLYNGDPPFDAAKAEENNIQINRNNLTGPNLLSQARRQWNQAFLKTGNFFSVSLDSGPKYKRKEWGHIITRNINRQLKRSRPMMEQIRATGANVMIYGIGPVMWKDKRSPIPVPLPVSSLLISSETDIDFENLEWFSVFREWTPTQLYDMTHGLRVDPGWNMNIVNSQLKWIAEQLQKEPNSTAYQYMPERIEELIKQDKGYWGSDAVPTIDVWDTYFREAEDGKGWYRRILLDWGLSSTQIGQYKEYQRPDSKNKDGDKESFIYTSGNRKYANNLSEIIHCQFGDCSAIAPFKYRSVRSLGWMLWGVCDLQNRLYCKFTESVFEQLMWFFKVASNQDFTRLKKADFLHMGVIPQGVAMLTSDERFKPDANLVEMAFAHNRELINESAASYTQDFNRSDRGSQKTATETMAIVNSVNALVSGMLNLAYTYEEYKYQEICRRFCIKDNPDSSVREFRLACIKEGVPSEALDSGRWEISAERTLGAGNKTLEMAQAQGLQAIRKNLGPEAQRKADHIMVEALTDDPDLAEDMAPIAGEKHISKSAHEAEFATERLLRVLPYEAPGDAVHEEYVVVWLRDMAALVQQINQRGAMATQQEIAGLMNLGTHIEDFLKIMEQNEDEKDRVKQYRDALGKLLNFVKAYSQRLAQQTQSGNGNSGLDAETQAKLAGKLMIDKAKSDNMRESHAARTAQRQTQFELEQQREEQRHNAEMRREAQKTALEMAGSISSNRMKSFQE